MPEYLFAVYTPFHRVAGERADCTVIFVRIVIQPDEVSDIAITADDVDDSGQNVLVRLSAPPALVNLIEFLNSDCEHVLSLFVDTVLLALIDVVQDFLLSVAPHYES